MPDAIQWGNYFNQLFGRTGDVIDRNVNARTALILSERERQRQREQELADRAAAQAYQNERDARYRTFLEGQTNREIAARAEAARIAQEQNAINAEVARTAAEKAAATQREWYDARDQRNYDRAEQDRLNAMSDQRHLDEANLATAGEWMNQSNAAGEQGVQMLRELSARAGNQVASQALQAAAMSVGKTPTDFSSIESLISVLGKKERDAAIMAYQNALANANPQLALGDQMAIQRLFNYADQQAERANRAVGSIQTPEVLRNAGNFSTIPSYFSAPANPTSGGGSIVPPTPPTQPATPRTTPAAKPEPFPGASWLSAPGVVNVATGAARTAPAIFADKIDRLVNAPAAIGRGVAKPMSSIASWLAPKLIDTPYGVLTGDYNLSEYLNTPRGGQDATSMLSIRAQQGDPEAIAAIEESRGRRGMFPSYLSESALAR